MPKYTARSDYAYDFLIFIGRFQPFHKGHYHVVEEALKLSDNVILVIGSHEKARSTRNPYTTLERCNIISSCFQDLFHWERMAGQRRLHYAPQHDHTYNDDRWIASIQASVNAIVLGTSHGFKSKPLRIGIVGYDKDHSTYYLKKFPQWEFVQIDPVHNMDATRFRHELYTATSMDMDWFINEQHHDLILDQMPHELCEEYEYINAYRKSWANTPYPVTFSTVDAVVVQSGHILLVERGELPGQGLWALPGGFVNQEETLEQAVLRELTEETDIDIPVPVLKGSLVKQRTFDDPHRSERGRTITEAYLFKLPEAYPDKAGIVSKLPKVTGKDDAKDAFWVSFADVVQNREKFFEDHFAIIENMVGL